MNQNIMKIIYKSYRWNKFILVNFINGFTNLFILSHNALL